MMCFPTIDAWHWSTLSLVFDAICNSATLPGQVVNLYFHGSKFDIPSLRLRVWEVGSKLNFVNVVVFGVAVVVVVAVAIVVAVVVVAVGGDLKTVRNSNNQNVFFTSAASSI